MTTLLPLAWLFGLLAPLHTAPPTPTVEAVAVSSTAAAPVKYDNPDLITLKSGKEIECRILVEGEEVILARVGARK